jgi:ligand-binding SRPBCC domain-containing protein
MPHYTSTLEIARPLAEMFAFFARPRNLLQFTPPDMNLELLTGPEILELGSRLVWKGRRWGISQQITQQVATFEKDKRIVVEQMKGPFSKWLQTHDFETTDAGMRIVEMIEFAPPGGLLGFAVSADSIRKELEKVSAYRATKLKEMFG